MAKADAKRIEALGRQMLQEAFELYVGVEMSEQMLQKDFAERFCCNEADMPAIIEKARELLPKAG